MKRLLAIVFVVLAGCATQKNIATNTGFTHSFNDGLKGWTAQSHTFANNLAYFDTANVAITTDKLNLKLTAKKKGGKAFTGAELRSQSSFLYGKFEARLKPTAKLGCISAFFLYKAGGGKFNEIDMEFSGKYPAVVTLNHWVNEQSHGKDIKLGFDASKSYHTYTIDWQPKKISWLIDGQLVYETEKAIPHKALQVVFNLWATKSISWAGQINAASLPANFFVDQFTYTPYSR